jgi:DNA primase
MVKRRSAISAKSLFHTQEDLRGAVLYIQEVAGSKDAEFTIRVLQSDGRLVYEATERTRDGLRSVVHEVPGPTVIVQTTTQNHLHPENETRVFPIYLDESQEQTDRIVRKALENAAGLGASAVDRQNIVQKWRDAVSMLEPYEVIIPYATRIQFPIAPVRLRRDAPRLLDLIRVITWLHQHQRERDQAGRLLATEADFETARRLTGESLAKVWQTRPPSERRVMDAIENLAPKKKTQGFYRKELGMRDLSETLVKEILRSLSSNGYLDCERIKGTQGFKYRVAGSLDKTVTGISLRPPRDEEDSLS